MKNRTVKERAAKDQPAKEQTDNGRRDRSLTAVNGHYPVVDVSQVDIAFPASVGHLMPAWEEIPKSYNNVLSEAVRFAEDWFFCGLKGALFEPREGVDKARAVKHLRCILGSFEPMHEYKIAAVAFLIDHWFSAYAYQKDDPGPARSSER